ncbi:MAG TPA: nuclear transport factor 2 family protein [Pseudomonas sp.]|jgi:ketosteroid isomerase-like protein
MSDHANVLHAAADLVTAFAANNRKAYFDAFSVDATFVFYNLEKPLLSRDAWQALWDSWRLDGFEILSCHSSHQQVNLLGDTAIFLHDVTTELRVQGEQSVSHERETIVFARQASGEWLAVHEHLSAIP